jgi:uncharacterized protein YggE
MTTMRLLIALCLVPTLVFAQDPRDSLVAVSANKGVRVPADRAHFYVSTDGSSETTDDALARATAKMAAVIQALRALGDGVEVGEPVTYSLGPAGQGRGFAMSQGPATQTARIGVRVTVRRVAMLSRTLSAASLAGASGMSAMQFDADVTEAARQSLVREAINALRTDAQAVATALGGRLGALVDVSVREDGRMFTQQLMLAGDAPFMAPTAAPEVNVNLSVSMRFKLVR